MKKYVLFGHGFDQHWAEVGSFEEARHHTPVVEYKEYEAEKVRADGLEVALMRTGKQLTQADSALEKAEQRIAELECNIKELEAVAQSWMNDYDNLKAKYEPVELLTSTDAEALKEGDE